MKSVPSTELDQWAVLRAAVEAGSFAKAAAMLNRSQSSVSYAIARLQERLGTELFRLDGRRAVLTEAGQLLLAEAGPLVDEFRRLEARARMMSEGQEPRVRLQVDAIAPKRIVFSALSKFRQMHQGAEIVLKELVRQPVSSLPVSDYDLAISFWEDRAPHAFRFVDVEMVAVAAQEHPLLQRGTSLSSSVLSHHPMVLIDRDEETIGRSVGSGRHLRVNSVESAIEAVRSGFCHGRLPRHLIEDDLKSGRLRALPIAEPARVIPLVLTYANPEMAGPLTRAMAELLRQESELQGSAAV
jgi:DNA-binding transcriptional LysR family regulator